MNDNEATNITAGAGVQINLISKMGLCLCAHCPNAVFLNNLRVKSRLSVQQY